MTQLYRQVGERAPVGMPRALPADFANILNFHLVEQPEAYGWYPFSEAVLENFDMVTHKAVPRDIIRENIRTDERSGTSSR
jgi:hypothetical protein